MGKGNPLDQFLIELGNQTYKLLRHKGASHYEAEDVVQETYYKLIKLLPEISHKLIKPWFFRVALNYFIDEKRKVNRLILVDNLFFDDYQERTNDFQKIADVDQIELELDQIKLEYREIMLLKYYYQLSYEEIGEVLLIKPASVKQKLARARKSIIMERSKKNES